MNGFIKTVQLFNFGLVILLAFSALFWSNLYLPESLTFIGRFHPIVLHLPIGLFFICLLFLPLKKYIEGKSGDELQQLFLELTTLFALLSAQVGLLLAREDGYTADNIADHKNAALVFAFGLYVFTWLAPKIKPTAQRIGLGVLALVLTFAGHNGAVITHGEDFLFPSTNEEEKTMLDPLTASAYDWAIAPILKKKCQSCHNQRKSKGGLLLLDSLTMMQGGENGAVVMVGNSAESKLVQFTLLPHDDDLHMPPTGKPQLTQQEVLLISNWIDEGLSFSKKLADYDDTTAFAQLLNQQLADREEVSYAFDAADAKTIQKIESPFLSIRPLAAGSPALDASFYVSSAFDINKLTELQALQEQIVHLSLINMPITDNDLNQIAPFDNLEKLNLNGTSITENGLNTLKGLDKLKSLSLSGTDISPPADDYFNQWPELQKLYISDTEISFADATAMQARYPELSIYATPPSDELSMLSPPAMKGNKVIYQADEPIVFAQRINGAEIKYTLDGSTPDSTNGILYTEPIKAKRSLDIKAIVQKKGWQTSPVATYHVYTMGITPTAIKQTTKANTKYPGIGPETVINGEKASVNNLQDPNWMGFREEPYISTFAFNEPKTIQQMSFAYGTQIPAYVFPPTQVTVLAGSTPNNLKIINTIKLPTITEKEGNLVQNDVLHIPLEGTYSHYQIKAQNLQLIPKWHNGKGQKGWLFVDEIFFYE